MECTHIAIVVAISRSTDFQLFPILEMENRLFKIRGTKHILVTARTNGVETKSGKYIPSRGLPIILVTTIAIRSR